MAVSNTITYETVYRDVLQDRLDHPTTFKEVAKVSYKDTKITSSSYMSTEPSVQTVTRGTGTVLQTYAETAQTLDIATGRDLGVFIDFADLAQSPWTKPSEAFSRIGALLNEYIEGAVLAQHASWTDFDNASIGGSAGDITVSASNIDDIVRGIKREIREANGQSMMNANGAFAVWRAADFEILEAFTQANGFNTADQALKNGTVEGLHYLGMDHYWSNEHTSGHLFAGVKNVQELGILRATYGQAHVIPFPSYVASSGESSFLSGNAYYSRVDIGHLTPAAHAGILFDVAVA